MCWLCMYMGILECIRVDHDLQTTITHISNTLVVDVYIFDAIHVFVMLLFYMILSVLFHVKAFSQTNLSELLQESGIVPAVHEACGGGGSSSDLSSKQATRQLQSTKYLGGLKHKYLIHAYRCSSRWIFDCSVLFCGVCV